jgi:hypothetical protein
MAKLFQWCPKQQAVVPIEKVHRERKAIDLFIQDDMPETRNPLNPNEVYTSKSKLRAAYKAAGAIEVGDAYDKGYIPDRESGASERRLLNSIKTQFVERLRYGR